jgi:hypothetical protein
MMYGPIGRAFAAWLLWFGVWWAALAAQKQLAEAFSDIVFDHAPALLPALGAVLFIVEFVLAAAALTGFVVWSFPARVRWRAIASAAAVAMIGLAILARLDAQIVAAHLIGYDFALRNEYVKSPGALAFFGMDNMGYDAESLIAFAECVVMWTLVAVVLVQQTFHARRPRRAQ